MFLGVPLRSPYINYSLISLVTLLNLRVFCLVSLVDLQVFNCLALSNAALGTSIFAYVASQIMTIE